MSSFKALPLFEATELRRHLQANVRGLRERLPRINEPKLLGTSLTRRMTCKQTDRIRQSLLPLEQLTVSASRRTAAQRLRGKHNRVHHTYFKHARKYRVRLRGLQNQDANEAHQGQLGDTAVIR